MKSKIAGTALVLLAGLALASPAAAQEKLRVTLGSLGFLYTGVMAAELNGDFAAQGLDVEITNAGSGSNNMAALIAGEANITVTATSSVFRAREEELDLKIVGAAINQVASNIVISADWAAEKGITAESSYEERLEALRGSTMGVTTPGSGTDQLIRYFATEAGLNPDQDMTLATLGGTGGMVPSLERGVINGYTASPPVPEVAVEEFGAVVLFDLIDGQVPALDGMMYQSVVARESYLAENSDSVVRFLRGLQSALDAIHDPAQSDGIRDKVWEAYFNNTEKGLFDTIWANFANAHAQSVEITAEQIDQVVAFQEAVGEPVTEEIRDAAWTNEYAAQAVAAP